MAYFDLSKQNVLQLMCWKRSNPNCNGNRRDKVALRPPELKFRIEHYENTDKLSVCRIFSLQRTLELVQRKNKIIVDVVLRWVTCGDHNQFGRSYPKRSKSTLYLSYNNTTVSRGTEANVFCTTSSWDLYLPEGKNVCLCSAVKLRRSLRYRTSSTIVSNLKI